MDRLTMTLRYSAALIALAPALVSDCFGQGGCTDCGEVGQWLTRPNTVQELIQNSVPDSLSQGPMTPLTDMPPLTQSSSVFDGGVGGTLTDLSSVPGYIEWAAPQNQFRMRFDGMFNNSFPDRAEFIYARAGGPGPGTGNRAVFNSEIDLYDARAYLELGDNGRWSVFTDIPVRWIQPGSDVAAASGNAGGLGDIEAGFKYALINDQDTIATFMLRGYFPSGDGRDGLGTDHYSLEPGLLIQRRISPDTVVFGELRDWIPLDGTNFAGNVLRYGVGVGYSMVECQDYTVSPIAEVVGWSVLDGLQTNPNTIAVESAETTIVNLKVGLRITFPDSNTSDASSLYVGYGHALTNDEWYKDILRVDYSIFF